MIPVHYAAMKDHEEIVELFFNVKPDTMTQVNAVSSITATSRTVIYHRTSHRLSNDAFQWISVRKAEKPLIASKIRIFLERKSIVFFAKVSAEDFVAWKKLILFVWGKYAVKNGEKAQLAFS